MPSSLSLADLIALNRNRWMLPLLADLAAHQGARFVELVHRLGIARDSLVRTLDAAQAQGWVIPNPGHGHPLRPEYVLTDEGVRFASRASAIGSAQCRIGIAPGTLTRWGIPLVFSIGSGHRRFSALSRQLDPASPRAVSQGLQRLADHHLIHREVVEGFPPSSRYGLTSRGQVLAAAM